MNRNIDATHVKQHKGLLMCFIFSTSTIQNNTVSKEGKCTIANSLNGAISPNLKQKFQAVCPNYKHKTQDLQTRHRFGVFPKSKPQLYWVFQALERIALTMFLLTTLLMISLPIRPKS